MKTTLHAFSFKVKFFILPLAFVFCPKGVQSQTTVTHVQQTGNYCTTFVSGGASGSFNNGTNQMGNYANTSGAKQVINWRNFTTNGTSPCTNARSLQVGDQVVITLSATRAYGRIGFALLASPTKLTWADRESNYALSVNLDGPLYLGGSTYGNWYIKYNGGSTSAASFGGQQTTYQNFTFTMTLTAVDRMNVSVTNNSTSTTSNFYDVLLNNSNPITDYSVFLEDDWDGGANRNIYWGLGGANQQHTVTDNRSLSIGQSNGSFTISSVLPDGKAANLTTGSVPNNLTKVGTGTLTLTGANSYTGTTTVSGGTLVLNRTGGTTIPTGSSVTVNSGATLKISSDQQLASLTVNGGGIVTVDPGVTLAINGALTNSGTVTMNGTLKMNQGSSVTGTAIVYGSSSTLNYAGTSTQTATAIEFPASSGPVNLSVSSGASLAIPSSFARTVSGNVVIASTGSLSINSQLTVGGNFTNNGSYSAGAVLVFGGTGTQTWVDANGNTYAFVAVNNSGSGVVMNNNITIGALNLSAGTLDINGNTFTITALINYTSGTITGSSTSNMVIGSSAGTLNFTQTSAATRSLNNLTLNNGATATLGSDLDVYGTITLSNAAATLDLDSKHLTLKSNATNTARIAALAADGSNLSNATNITMERWIPARGNNPSSGGRAYRLLAPTVNTSGSIKANWQEGQMNTTVGTNVNGFPGNGTHITGAGGNTNGFDVTQTNAPSLYATTNGITPTYTAYTSTNGTMDAKTGYWLYIRGDRSVSTTIPLADGMPTTSTTLRTTGAMLKGTQTFTGLSTTPLALNLVTNPYPSAIDWASVYSANSPTDIGSSYTLWDPNIGTRGGFVTVTNTGTVVPPESGATLNIQSGQAFFVQTVSGTGTAFTISESQKVANNSNAVFRNVPVTPESFSVSLFYNEATGFRRLADGATAIFDNSYSKKMDIFDAVEINNWDENIAIAREGKHLAIESRPVIVKTDTIPLFMNNMKQKTYEFEFKPATFTNKGLKAELIDNFTGKRTPLSVTSTTVVSFTVTGDAASLAADRFKVIFGHGKAVEPPIKTNSNLITIFPNPVKGNSFSVELANLAKGTYTISLVNNLGQPVFTTQVLHPGGDLRKSIGLNSMIGAGTYRLMVRGGDNVKLNQLIIKD